MNEADTLATTLTKTGEWPPVTAQCIQLGQTRPKPFLQLRDVVQEAGGLLRARVKQAPKQCPRKRLRVTNPLTDGKKLPNAGWPRMRPKARGCSQILQVLHQEIDAMLDAKGDALKAKLDHGIALFNLSTSPRL